MLAAKRSFEDKTVIIELSGTIEEGDDPCWIIQSIPSEVIVSAKGVKRINSAGIRIWIRYFESLLANGTKVTFTEIPSVLIQTAKIIPNFFCGGKIDSFYVPLACSQCKNTFSTLVRASELKEEPQKFLSTPCPVCEGPSVLDDDDSYFRF